MSSLRVPINSLIYNLKYANCASACDIVNPKKLGRLLCLTVMQHIFNVQHPGIDFSAPITMDEAGAAQAFLLLQFAFDGPYRKKGKILCSCMYDRC